ncbi:MAG: hypothetical protein SPI71_01255 [Acidaminococcaceae bacterium]|nr:hypothetical protein [Acidaminococcaceae bacterium]
MLARKYENYSWQEPEYTYSKQERSEVSNVVESDKYRALRNRLLLVLGIVMAFYTLAVFRSEALVRHGSELVSMRQQEAQLIRKNNELKIEVGQLKGPDRIIGLASQNMGMQVARSNIYVKALPGTEGNVGYALADK